MMISIEFTIDNRSTIQQEQTPTQRSTNEIRAIFSITCHQQLLQTDIAAITILICYSGFV